MALGIFFEVSVPDLLATDPAQVERDRLQTRLQMLGQEMVAVGIREREINDEITATQTALDALRADEEAIANHEWEREHD